MNYQNTKTYIGTNIYRYNINNTKTKAYSNHATTQNFLAGPNLTQKSNLVQQSIESSNKLDELLKKCKQIGTSCQEKNPKLKTSISTQAATSDSKLRKINNYKLVKNLISPKQLRVYHRALPVYRTASRFKLIKSKTKPIRNNLNSLLNQNKANFSQGHTRHTSKSFSVYWQTHRINKYKLSNLNSLPKKSQKNKFKIVNNRLNKYKLINSNELKLNQIELNKKIVIANNLVNRSKLTINRTVKKIQIQSFKFKANESRTNLDNKTEKKYCLFFNRFGRCSRGSSCTYIHDPKRVSLCPRFLRGTCKVENCPFSHETNPEKIPVCSFFASGCCNRENCPYQHIFYGKDAEFCIDFAKGYCPLGSKCDKLHLIECPEFDKNKKCPRGQKCPLLHRKKKIHAKKKESINTNEINLINFVPDFKPNNQNIKIFESKESKIDSKETFKLRPSFAIKKTENSK